MLRLATVLLIITAVLGQAMPTHPSSMEAHSQGKNVQDIGKLLRHYDLIALDPANVAEQVRQTGQLSVSTSEGILDLSLSPHDIRAPHYYAEEINNQGPVRNFQRPASLTYKGTVRGIDGSQARFTIDGNVVEGLIITPTQKYFVEPALRYTFSAARSDYVVYKNSDVIPNFNASCPLTLWQEVRSEVERVGASAAVATEDFAGIENAVVSPPREVEIATEADNEFVQAMGTAQAANNEILSILNMVDGVYQTEIGLTFNVVFQRAWVAQDPYSATTDVSALLTELRSQWNSNPPAGAPPRDVVHMWTGKSTNAAGFAFGGRTGVVNDGVVCRDAQFGGSAAYGLSQRFTNAVAKVVIPAHEIGHNFGATHPDQEGGHPECSTTIMNSDATNSTMTFCQFSGDQITSYLSASSNGITPNNSCLAVATNPLPTVQFSVGSQSVSETLDQTMKVDLTVTRTGDTSASASIDYATADGTASERSDYMETLGTLRFAAGEPSKTITVFIVDDRYGEGAETFTVNLSNPIGCTIGNPATLTVTINSNEAVNGLNPVKDASFNTDFFVRQHYVDFFNREGDAPGLAFWKNQIDGCVTQQCREITRINVSGSFFLSLEFQDTGYLVHRFYKAAYGDAVGTSTWGGTHTLPVPVVRFNQFLPDTQQIGRGVQVGIGNWQEQLETNKQAFALAFVQRGAFSARYSTTLSPTTFVDNLFATAGVTPSAADRQAAIDEFGGAPTTTDMAARGRAMRRVAENSILALQEKNKAFVLMQYFGYLRRDPNDTPDADHTGYDFWLIKLNQFNGNYIDAEMVKAFITSIEYEQRFGT